jgi:hypothetical protein
MLARTIPVAPTPADRCDFCFVAGQPLTGYPCRPFETRFILRGGVVLVRQCTCCPGDFRPGPRDVILASHASLEAWGACPVCAALLDGGALDALGRRMVARLLADRQVALAHRPLVARQILATLQAFWRHRLPIN